MQDLLILCCILEEKYIMDNDLELKRNHISILSNIHIRNGIIFCQPPDILIFVRCIHLPMVKLFYSKIGPSLFITVQLNQTKKSLK